LKLKPAISYIRWSSGQQRLGHSKQRQVQATEAYCKLHGYELKEQLVDDGLSAYKGANLKVGKLGIFLETLRRDKGKTIPVGTTLIIENLDRLTRKNTLEAQRLFLEILSYGIKIVTLQDQQHYSEEDLIENPSPLYVSLGAMIRANQESAVKGDRVRRAREARRQRGKTGEKFEVWCPPWCDFKNGQYIVNEQSADTVRRIFKDYLNGLGMVTIANRLNRDKVPTLSPRCKEWYKKYILTILKDRKVVGYAHWLEKENYFPTIIPKATFDAAQLRLTERYKKRGPVGKDVANLFTGLCKCPKCGNRMVRNVNSSRPDGGDYAYIVCANARRGMICDYKSIVYGAVEASFIQLLDCPEFYAAMHETEDTQGHVDKLKSLREDLAKAKKQIAKLRKLIIDDDSPSKSLVQALKGFERDETDLSRAIQLQQTVVDNFKELPAEAIEIKNQMHTKLRDPDFRLKLREMIRSLVAKIVINTMAKCQNYQVYWKNGNVSSVVLAPVTYKDRTKGHIFGVFKGVVSEATEPQLVFAVQAA